jgi:nickel-dependent lactate racemase
MVNVVLDNHKKVNTIISGELFDSHLKAVDYVKEACCHSVTEQADLVITSSGDYPLDATFYQCLKGFVNCLPAVKPNG